jgi:hypothetical protein
MDDFVLSNLQEAKNEWCSRLVSIFTPLISEGVKSIFNESWRMCIENDEVSKYLMTFQNLLSRVPKWNSVIVEEERKRIIERSGCNYLEDLITCVHIIQLKVLTSIRVGNKQKKIDISIPKLDHFIHKVYIHVARKIYMNVYLFEKNVNPLQLQKNNRELEVIIQECILLSIRESIPTEAIIRAYMDESVEQDEEVIIENMEEPVMPGGKLPEPKDTGDATQEPATAVTVAEPVVPEMIPAIQNLNDDPVITRLSFNDYDSVMDTSTNSVEKINAPKSIERLEEISTARAIQRRLDEEMEDDEDRIKIHSEPIDLTGFDVLDDIGRGSSNVLMDDPILDFEEL